MFKTENPLAFLELFSLRDSGAKALVALGNTLLIQGRFRQASTSYSRAIKAIFDKFILNTRLGQFGDTWSEKGYIANHDYHFIYCPIPKVACSSFKRLAVQLSNLENKEEILKLPSRLLHSYVAHNLTFFANYNSNRQEAMKLLDNNEYFKFAIVRNPWDRLTSAYLNKFITPVDLRASASPGKEVVEKFYREKGLKPDWEKAITFRQFVDYLLVNKDEDIDGHWRPQHLFLNNTKLDFIGRFENLIEDFEYIKKRLNITLNLPWSNKSNRVNHGSYTKGLDRNRHYSDYGRSELRKLAQYPKYQEFYTPELIELVRQRYRKDVEMFGYEFASLILPNGSIA